MIDTGTATCVSSSTSIALVEAAALAALSGLSCVEWDETMEVVTVLSFLAGAALIVDAIGSAFDDMLALECAANEPVLPDPPEGADADAGAGAGGGDTPTKSVGSNMSLFRSSCCRTNLVRRTAWSCGATAADCEIVDELRG